MIGASFAARARQGGAALARPFDGRNLDLTTGPAPGVSLATFTQTTTNGEFAVGSSMSGQAYYLGTSLTAQKIRYATTNPSGVKGQAFRVALYPNGGAIVDCDTDIGLYNLDTNTAAPGQIIRCRVATDINAQEGDAGGDSGAIDAGGLIKDCDVSGTAVDGIWPGYNTGQVTPGPWTVVQGCRAVGATCNYYGGYLYGGTYPYTSTYAPGQPDSNTGLQATKAQILAATPWQASLPVTNGELITAVLGTLGSGLYQVVSAGTLGTENPSGNWPDTNTPDVKWSDLPATQTQTPVQPFTSGTAQLVFIGGAFHSDAGQTTGRQRVAHRRGMAADFAGSCFLCQNAAGNTNPLPPMNWVWEDYIFRGGGTYDVYVQTQSGDNTSSWTFQGSSGDNGQGGFIRNSDATWSLNPTMGKSRPWHTSFRRNTHLQPISPLSPRGGRVPSFNDALSKYGAIVVSSEAVRDAGIAAQFGWDATDQRLGMMRDGTYDYTTMPAPVSSVLEARLQAFNAQFATNAAISSSVGNMDARCWIVWEPNILSGTAFQAGVLQSPALLLPHAAANSVNVPANVAGLTDANGYYIGG